MYAIPDISRYVFMSSLNPLLIAAEFALAKVETMIWE